MELTPKDHKGAGRLEVHWLHLAELHHAFLALSGPVPLPPKQLHKAEVLPFLPPQTETK